MKNLGPLVGEAVRFFWRTRSEQSAYQGTVSGVKDAGLRTEATGGAQLDGFAKLVESLLTEAGIKFSEIHNGRSGVEIPGWFRPEKKWDLLVVSGGHLIAAVEFKAHIGPSFGNNYNNRTEEALGNATDVLAAYREGAFKPSARPWLGYLMLVEDSLKSQCPVRVAEPHFPVFDEFRDASYIKRYEVGLTKLLREQLYDGVCLITSPRDTGLEGAYNEPSEELSFQHFATGLIGRAKAHVEGAR
ncbi:MAG: PaeR7I family type II restriction endonuclease [bacterium]